MTVLLTGLFVGSFIGALTLLFSCQTVDGFVNEFESYQPQYYFGQGQDYQNQVKYHDYAFRETIPL